MAQPAARHSDPLDVVGASASRLGTTKRHLDLERLEDRYTLRQPAEIERYLRQYPDLVPLLLDSADAVPRYFGPDAPLALELFVDPESDPGERELFALIGSRFAPDESLARSYRFLDEWWSAKSPAGPAVLVFDIESR